MTDLRRRAGPLWRQSATPEEVAELERIDAKIESISAQRRVLMDYRRHLTNRLANRTLARARAHQEAAQ